MPFEDLRHFAHRFLEGKAPLLPYRTRHCARTILGACLGRTQGCQLTNEPVNNHVYYPSKSGIYLAPFQSNTPHDHLGCDILLACPANIKRNLLWMQSMMPL